MDRATKDRCQNIYRTVGGRCAVRFADLELGIPDETAIKILEQLGIVFVRMDVVAIAREQVGKRYRRGAKQAEAPDVYDCSSLTKWVYGEAGIWLPRYSIDQRTWGSEVRYPNLRAGDLLFSPGAHPYYWGSIKNGVGHVGIYTGENSVIHAANSVRGVVEESYVDFWGNGPSRGAKRMLARETVTAIVPPEFEIENALQFRWMVLQRL